MIPQTTGVQTIQYPQMLEAVSKIFPYEELQKQVRSVFDALFCDVKIENLTYEKKTETYSERGFIEKITITLDKEYVLRGRITAFVAPAQAIKLPKVIEMVLDEEEGVFEIEHGIVNFSKEKAPIELFPSSHFNELKEKPDNEKNCCEMAWVEFANRINYGTGVLVSLRHTDQIKYCGQYGHTVGGSMNQSHLSEALASFQSGSVTKQ